MASLFSLRDEPTDSDVTNSMEAYEYDRGHNTDDESSPASSLGSSSSSNSSSSDSEVRINKVVDTDQSFLVAEEVSTSSSQIIEVESLVRRARTSRRRVCSATRSYHSLSPDH